MCHCNIFLSIFTQAYNIIIDHGVNVTGHGREVFDGLNTTDKMFLSQLIKTVQLSSSKGYDTNMAMHYSTHKDDVSLAW